MVKLSIIIPYYKTYELTIKLLKELYIQKNDDVEIILINDGCIEDNFDLFKDKNVYVINQKNYGVSYSRNRGIKRAKGKYIAFIDSDDMVMPDYIEKLLELINTRNEEIIIFNWMDSNTNAIIRHPDNCAVWKAIYKKEIVPKFDESMRSKEDYFWQIELNRTIHTKYYYDRVLYIYNSGRENSLSWRDNQK